MTTMWWNEFEGEVWATNKKYLQNDKNLSSMKTLKVKSREETQKEFEDRLKYILGNNKLTGRVERVQELRKMFEPHGYEIPVSLYRKLLRAKLLYK